MDVSDISQTDSISEIFTFFTDSAHLLRLNVNCQTFQCPVKWNQNIQLWDGKQRTISRRRGRLKKYDQTGVKQYV